MIEKLYTNDLFFKVVSIVAFVLTLVTSVINLVFYDGYNILVFLDIINCVCIATLYISYVKHSKNIMKGVMGCVLMEMFIQSSLILFDEYEILEIFYFVLTGILMINHFIINGDHHSSPFHVYVNQIVVVLIACITLCIFLTILPSEPDLYAKLNDIAMCIGQCCSFAAIVCVESRLDAYRIDRENAGWTKESGYPEGYVHQKDRK